jgi:hypothetical protein
MARTLPLIASLVVVLALPSFADGATAPMTTRFAGITAGGRTLTFDSDSPGAIRSAARITGLLPQEHLAAITLRLPQGAVYGLGTASRLYVLDPLGGATLPVSKNPLDFNLRGFNVGFDVDPKTGLLRTVNDADQNFRINPYTARAIDHNGASPLLEPDPDLHYADADDAAGSNPNISAIAYAPGGLLYGIDTAQNVLVTISPADDGVVHTVGPLGFNAVDAAGFDITDDGVAWASFRVADGRETGLYRINLLTGQAFRAGKANSIGSVVGGRLDPVRSIVALGKLPADRRKPRFSVAARVSPPVVSLLRGRALKLTGACDEACTLVARLVLGGRTVGTATTRIRDLGGTKRFNLKLSRRGRTILRHARGGRLRLAAVATDAAGNRATFPKRKAKAKAK